MSQAIPDGSVVITPVEQYHKLEAVEKGLIDLTAAVSALADTVKTQANGERRTLDDHEKRIRSLEWRIYAATGFAAAIAGAGGGILAQAFGGG